MLINPRDGDEAGLQVWYDAQSAMWGYLPNYAAAFASRPEIAAAWMQLNRAVRSGMERRRYELVTMAAAQALRSTYCTAAHATFMRDACEDEPTMLVMAADPDGEALDETDRAVVAFARKVAQDASGINEGDVDALRTVGLTDNDIADVVFAAAARSFFAKVLDGVGVNADHQLASAFDDAVARQLTVGRPIATPPRA